MLVLLRLIATMKSLIHKRVNNLLRINIFFKNNVFNIYFKELSNTGSLSKISRNSSKSSILEDKRSSQTNQHHINPKSSSKLIHKEKFITPQNRKQINQYSRDYDIMNLTQVGYLSGNNLIKNSEDIDMNMFENYYDQNSDLGMKN